MNGLKIVSIDKKIISKQTKAHLKRLAFEEAATYLKVSLGDGALVHEGADHIAVHLEGRQDRVLFIRRTDKRKRRTLMKKLFSMGVVAVLFVMMLVPTAQAIEPFLAEDPENPYMSHDPETLGQPYEYPSRGFEPWGIYWPTKLDRPYGDASDDFTLSMISCILNNDIIRTTLQDVGVYEGQGTSEYPNLTLHGECVTTNPHQATYVLGNYLNYLAELEFQKQQVLLHSTWPPVLQAGHMYLLLQSYY